MIRDEDVRPPGLGERSLDGALARAGVGEVGLDRDCARAQLLDLCDDRLETIGEPLDQATTAAPSPANPLAVARPNPAPAPVIRTLRPSNRGSTYA